MKFPAQFLWGSASAAYQVEGAHLEDGRTPCIWDALSKGHVKHGDNGDTACDHYHRFREDVAMMKQLGLQAYRFSISWSRIMPSPGVINSKGIAFYSELVDELLRADIRPMITLYHWDMPMWAYERGGWQWDGISDAFAAYAEVVVDALSDRVDTWMTMNELSTFVSVGHFYGAHAPFETADLQSYEGKRKLRTITRNVLLAHAKAARVIRKKAKLKPQVGLAMDGTLYTPVTETAEEIEAARAATADCFDRCNAAGWWMEPIMNGNLPPLLADAFTEEELSLIHQPLDFMGYNCYRSQDYDEADEPNPRVYPGIPRTAIGWVITPDALYWAVRFYTDKWHIPVMITENGMANIDFVMSDGCVHDPQRIDYLTGYLHGLKRAVAEGYPVLGYLYWSIMDNFEWAEGYDQRFGLVYVDFLTQKRTIKDSAKWYADVIASAGETL